MDNFLVRWFVAALIVGATAWLSFMMGRFEERNAAFAAAAIEAGMRALARGRLPVRRETARLILRDGRCNAPGTRES